jgi:hypothetical protein
MRRKSNEEDEYGYKYIVATKTYQKNYKGIKIESKRRLNECDEESCEYLILNKLCDIEKYIRDSAKEKKIIPMKNEIVEENYTCDCGNDIKFSANIYKLVIDKKKILKNKKKAFKKFKYRDYISEESEESSEE